MAWNLLLLFVHRTLSLSLSIDLPLLSPLFIFHPPPPSPPQMNRVRTLSLSVFYSNYILREREIE